MLGWRVIPLPFILSVSGVYGMSPMPSTWDKDKIPLTPDSWRRWDGGWDRGRIGISAAYLHVICVCVGDGEIIRSEANCSWE